jgi:small subunit ribosomal protein S20
MEGNDLANIKSAKKRVLVNAKKAARNKSIKSGVKTSVKKVEAAIAAGDKAAAVSALNAFKAEMGRATSKGVYKKNTKSRKVGRMSKTVDAMA